jgi:hypothetical protein
MDELQRMPLLDELDYVGVAKLRHRMTAADLRELHRPMMVLGPGDEPLALVITIAQYRAINAFILRACGLSIVG